LTRGRGNILERGFAPLKLPDYYSRITRGKVSLIIKGVRFTNNLLVRAIGYPLLGGFPYLYAGNGNGGSRQLGLEFIIDSRCHIL